MAGDEQAAGASARAPGGQPSLLGTIVADAHWCAENRGEPFQHTSRARESVSVLRLLFAADNFLPVVLYRIRAVLARAHVPVLPRLLDVVCAAVWRVRIGPRVTMRERVYLPHGNVSIGGATRIGREVVIAPWVEIGPGPGEEAAPTIEDGVFIATLARVTGAVTVGQGATVAAAADVRSDVPARAMAAGAPARVALGAIRQQGGAAEPASRDGLASSSPGRRPGMPEFDDGGDFLRAHVRQRPGVRALRRDIHAARARGVSKLAVIPVTCQRLRETLDRRHVPVLPWLLHMLNLALWNVSIGPHAVVGPGLSLSGRDVVIDGIVRVGRDVALGRRITVGLRPGTAIGPRIGDGTRIGDACAVAGAILVGAGVTVRPGTAVIRDVPDGATVAGVPGVAVLE